MDEFWLHEGSSEMHIKQYAKKGNKCVHHTAETKQMFHGIEHSNKATTS